MTLPRLTSLLLAACLCMPLVPAKAEVSCSLAMAASLAEPHEKPLPGSKQFRIFWHVGTQIEDIADAANHPSDIADVQRARDAVQGYYVLGGITGTLGYWPDRPNECRMNFKRLSDGETYEIDGQAREFEGGGPALRAECEKKLEESFTGKGKVRSAKDVRPFQAEAFRKAAGVLDFTAESRRGKQFMVPVLFKSPEFSYDAATGALELQSIPGAYCALAGFGVTPDRLMLYQEYHLKKAIRVPRSAGQMPSNADFLPQNLKALSLIEDSFEKASLPLGGVNLNFRSWNRQMLNAMNQFHRNRSIEGVNFEVTPGLLNKRIKVVNQIADGMSYVLTNTDYEISVLIPGYWDDIDTATEEGIDSLGTRTRRLVGIIDRKMRENMGQPDGRSPLCTEKIAFIPASYGAPVHPETLPAQRKGKWAGTVTGQIGLLNDIRQELCGT